MRNADDRATYFPHVDVLLRALRIGRDRLDSAARIAIDARLLKALIQAALAHEPFSEEFYFTTYPDLRQAAAIGALPDPRRHFIETGYFEGRLGAPPLVTEEYYAAENPDVAEAVRERRIDSPLSHYVASGAAEGRVPNPAAREAIERWMGLLQPALPR